MRVSGFVAEENQGVPVAFLYTRNRLTIRHQGRCTRTLNALQILTETMNVSRIGLHVFGHNRAIVVDDGLDANNRHQLGQDLVDHKATNKTGSSMIIRAVSSPPLKRACGPG